MAQQFLNLVIAHPVMLVIVQDRDKNVEVREQVT